MSLSRPVSRRYTWAAILGFALFCTPSRAQESPYLYGIHDHSPSPQEYLNHIASGGATGWVTATVEVGHNPTHYGGDDFRWISNQGHAVICRINNGYGTAGTIPVPSEYGNFAQRCANYVAASQGVVFALCCALGLWSSAHASVVFHAADPRPVVIDEVCGMLLVFLIVRITPLSLALGFAGFRLADIFKPFGIRRLERLPAPWGIMLDDLASGLLVGIFLWLARWRGML